MKKCYLLSPRLSRQQFSLADLPPSAQVMHYDKIVPEPNPSDESWDQIIDPDGS